VYDRAKTEATLYFTKQLSKQLCEGGHQLLFPTICVALAKTTPSIPLGAMGTYLAAAARTDLGQLPDRTLAYALHDLAADPTAPAREPLFGARIALAYYGTVRSGRTPIDVARSLHGIQVSDKVVGHDTEVFKATKVLSELLDAAQAQKGWTEISLGPGNTVTPIVTCYGLGAFFTFEKAYSVDGTPFGPIAADKIAEMIPVVAGYLLDAAALVNRAKLAKSALSTVPAVSSGGNFVSSAVSQGGASAASGLTARDYAIATTQTIEQTLQVGLRVLSGLGVQVNPNVRTVVNDVDAVVQIGEQVLSGQSPGDLVINTIALIQQLTNAAAGSPPPRALADIQQLLALIAQIADAKSADEVAAAITAAAAPASTYELKYANSMVAIGAMAGVSAGFETVRANASAHSSGAVIGAFAPVGLTASTPFGDDFHASLTLSVINLGALVSTRFSQDTKGTTTVDAAPQVKLANVLAPGLFVSIGLWKSPFVLAVGGQVIPIGRQLSTTAADGTTSTSTTPAIQLVGSLSVDVPILTF
jgi:hypothetical protein